MFRSRMLGEIVCANVPKEQFARRWVIAAASQHACEPFWLSEGFEVAINPDANEGMGTSVALAARLARDAGCDALMIALADMPLVPREHFAALAEAVVDDTDIIVSATATTRQPPAIFACRHFPALALSHKDRGARDLLEQGRVLECPARWLIDIDTPDDLRKHGQADA